MRVLLCGASIEDNFQPSWAHIYWPLVSAGHQVRTYDPVAAWTWDKQGSRDYVSQWIIRQANAELVIVVGDAAMDFESDLSDCVTIRLQEPWVHTPLELLAEYVQESDRDCLFRSHIELPTKWRSCATLLRGDANRENVAFASSLAEHDGNVLVLGAGWETIHGDLLSSATFFRANSLPYVYMGELMRHANQVINLPGERKDLFDLELSLAKERVLPTLHFPFTARGLVETNDGNITRKVSVKKDGPTVSTIIATYNVGQYLEDCVDSILAQTYEDHEVVIIDDGSTDATPSLLDAFSSNPRIRIFRQSNIGQTRRFDLLWRELTSAARGEYLSLIGSDDVAHPQRYARQVEVLNSEPDVDVVHTGAYLIDGKGNVQTLSFGMDVSYDSTSLLRRLIRWNTVASPTAMMRRDMFIKTGEWNEGFSVDYSMWTNAARTSTFRFLAQALTNYRVHETNVSTGHQADQGEMNGRLVRSHWRAILSLDELFPALSYLIDNRNTAMAAAHVELGNGFLIDYPDYELAIKDYDAALALNTPFNSRILINKASVLRLAGMNDEARACINEARSKLSGSEATNFEPGVIPMITGEQIDARIFELPESLAKATKVWDGTFANLNRIMVIPDWAHPVRLADVVNEYLRAFASNAPVDLVIPTCGLAANQVMEFVAKNIAADLNLENIPSLTIEEWNEFGLVPFKRFFSIVDLNDATSADQASVVFDALKRHIETKAHSRW